MTKQGISYFAILAIAAATAAFGGEDPSLETRDILGDRVSIPVPKKFRPMPSGELEMKYPGANRPAVVPEDESGTINVAFGLKNVEVSESDVPEMNAVLERQFRARYPTATWVKSGPVQINGYAFASLDLYVQALDTQMRNMIVATSLDGRLLLVSFNYPRAQDDQWAETAKAVISSISITKR